MPQPKRVLAANLAALLVSAAAAGCAAVTTDGPPPSATPAGAVRTYPLPTPAWPVASPEICAGVGLVGTDGKGLVLHGDPADPALTWLTNTDGSGRKNVVWSPGARARFNPGLEVLDASGAVIAREGMRITGACGVNPDGSIWWVPWIQ